MPRHRVILVVWLTAAALTLGAWVHSLFSQSHVAYRSAGLERHFQIGVAAGGVVIHAHVEANLSSPGFVLLSEPWRSEMDPFAGTPGARIPPPSYLGRFRARDGGLEVPLWFVFLFFTGCCLPFRLRAVERQRWKAHLLAVDLRMLEGNRRRRLPFKLY